MAWYTRTYAPFVNVSASGDLTSGDDTLVTDDLVVGGLATIGETLAVTGTSEFTGAAVFTGGATLNATTVVNAPFGAYQKVELITGATDTWAETDSGTLFLMSRSGGIDVALPALSAADVGVWFDVFVLTAVSADAYTFTAQAADLLAGRVLAWDTDTSYGTTSYAPDGSDDLIVTLNSTTTGGGVGGDYLRFVATSATQWLVTGQVFHTSNTATMFS